MSPVGGDLLSTWCQRGSDELARQLAGAGVEVRAFNPPRFDRPLAWLARDHRKAIVIDGQVAFVSGL